MTPELNDPFVSEPDRLMAEKLLEAQRAVNAIIAEAASTGLAVMVRVEEIHVTGHAFALPNVILDAARNIRSGPILKAGEDCFR
jgi:hypothetical protein